MCAVTLRVASLGPPDGDKTYSTPQWLSGMRFLTDQTAGTATAKAASVQDCSAAGLSQ